VYIEMAATLTSASALFWHKRSPVPSPADAQLDEIYGAPLSEFIAKRDALARDLKKAGDGPGADAISKARRPTVVAWAVNQVVRQEPGGLEELLDAAAKMHQAQSALLSGGDAAAFRAASERLRAAVRQLTDRAVKIAVDAGHGDSASAQGRIERTLFTSATGDEAARELLRRGRFAAVVAPADGLALGGFDVAAAPAPAAKPAKAAPPEKETKAATQARKKAELEVERLEALAREIDKQATRANKRAEALDAAAREAEAQAQVATARAVQARQEAAEAKVEALGLDTRARAAAQEAASARTKA
jgi:hypothetical protein